MRFIAMSPAVAAKVLEWSALPNEQKPPAIREMIKKWEALRASLYEELKTTGQVPARYGEWEQMEHELQQLYVTCAEAELARDSKDTSSKGTPHLDSGANI